ncbi:TOPRS ligase, partial [Eolophus roseicapillus]|nr:TOPRS ligase [Eolophus roseicapilla]
LAMENEWTCPICLQAEDDIIYLVPCHHQFCLGCIARWTDERPDCPLCRTPIETVRLSLRGEDNHLEAIVAPSEELPGASSQAGRAPGRLVANTPHRPVASPPSSPQEAGGPQTVAGLPLEEWAVLFQMERHLLDPVMPWLHQQLVAIYRHQWWQVMGAEAAILNVLCSSGPNREAMVQPLQPLLRERTEPLVSDIVRLIEERCSALAWRLLQSGTDQEQDESSTSSSSATSRASSRSSTTASRATSQALSSSPTDDSDASEEESSASEAVLRRVPSRVRGARIPAEQEQEQEPQEEPRPAAAPGPSGQGCSCSRSAPGRGRSRSPGRPRRAPKRRAPSPQASAQPCKRPPRRQH